MLPGKFLPRDTEIKKTNLKLTTYSKTNLKVCDNIPANWESKEEEEAKYRAEFAIRLMKITLHFLAH